MCLLAVVGVQPRLFAPSPTAELRELSLSDELSDEEDTVDVATEPEQEDASGQAGEGNDDGDDWAEYEGENGNEEDAESEIALDAREVSFIDESVDNAAATLKNAERRLTILADAYQRSPYILPQAQIDKVCDALKVCVEEYNKFAGTNFELVEPEEEII